MSPMRLSTKHTVSLWRRKTLATYLNESGYRTGIVGKWQLGAAPSFHPLNRGFDYFYGFIGGGARLLQH